MLRRVISMIVLWQALTTSLLAEVNGRYVRLEAPASSRMSVYEIEILAKGVNVALKNAALKFAGTGYKGRDINFRDEQRELVDGITDLKRRGFDIGTAGGLNPWVEIDLGKKQTLEQLRVIQSPGTQFNDRGLRLVSILDDDRKVVWVSLFDIRQKPYEKGTAEFQLKLTSHALVGRVISVNSAQWAPLGDVLKVNPLPEPPDAQQRAARFAERNSAAAIEKLAREFYARLDVSKPELKEVRARFERGDYSGSLDAYRDHFLRKIQKITFLHEHPLQVPSYDEAGEDLQRNIAVVFSRFSLDAHQFTPGKIDWSYVPSNSADDIDTARERDQAGLFQRALLTTYRKHGSREMLAKWSAITDDWGMNILTDLKRSKHDLRDYFVKEVMQEANHLVDELAQTARAQPEFASLLSGATLARLLIPILEEYPPAYWWPCRRATFNHTYNALNAATTTARILDDFHAGKRLDDENRRHWQRVWSMMMTRDGSMNEIGDEGHLCMQWRMGVTFNQMQKSPPPWFTPDFAAEFSTGWKQTATYPIRHLSPDGRGHRTGTSELFDEIWELSGRTCTYGNMLPRETIDSTAILREPAVAGILQSVFGVGRDRAKLSTLRQASYDKVKAFYGDQFNPPTSASDWLPYAGLHYLRRSWEPDAAFLAMICQPKDHPSTNGSTWNTSFQVWDYGQPLFRCGPVSIAGQPQFAAAGKQTWWPGSKTVELAVASEKPISARWHSSEQFDYTECFFEGTYQKHRVNASKGELQLDEHPIENARADRRVVFLKPLRLFVITDAVQTPPNQCGHGYEMQQRFGSPEVGKRKASATGHVEGDAAMTQLTHENAPGVTIRRFSKAKLNWNSGKQPSWSGDDSTLRAVTSGNLLLSTLIETHQRPGLSSVKSCRDLSSKDITGFVAELSDGSTLTWLATLNESRQLTAEGMTLVGQGLLVWRREKETTGLALGAEALSLGSAKSTLPASDFEFVLRGGKLVETTAIHRPIEPVTFLPAQPVFIGSTQITLTSGTPEVEIRYTLDGSEPGLSSKLYTGPITIFADSFIRARAFRPGVKSVPFAQCGTDVTVISDARYDRQDALPVTVTPQKLEPGLRWELVEANWSALFSHLNLPEVMPAVQSGTTSELLDVSMRRSDGPFGVRYSGYLNIPADGVWTFHAPDEYVGASCEPGYDLRVWIDGQEWDPGQRYHGLGLWSIALSKGLHRIQVTFADARHRDHTVHNSGLWRGYPTPWVTWHGTAPQLQISGPDFVKQAFPNEWLRRD